MSVYRDEPQPMDGGERSPGATEAPQVHFSAVNASGSAYALFVLPSTFFDHLVLHDASLFECLLHVKVRWAHLTLDSFEHTADQGTNPSVYLCYLI